MPTFFNCALCHRVSLMHRIRTRCPNCGSQSGEFSSAPPAPRPEAVPARSLPTAGPRTRASSLACLSASRLRRLRARLRSIAPVAAPGTVG